MMDAAKMHRMIELRRRRDELKLLLDEVTREEAALSETLVDQFADAGVQNVKTPQGTLYLHRSVSASLAVPEGMTPEQVFMTLQAHGLGWLVKETVNPQTLSAWVRERDKAGEPLPEGLAEIVRPFEKYTVRVRLDGAPPDNGA